MRKLTRSLVVAFALSGANLQAQELESPFDSIDNVTQTAFDQCESSPVECVEILNELLRVIDVEGALSAEQKNYLAGQAGTVALRIAAANPGISSIRTEMARFISERLIPIVSDPTQISGLQQVASLIADGTIADLTDAANRLVVASAS